MKNNKYIYILILILLIYISNIYSYEYVTLPSTSDTDTWGDKINESLANLDTALTTLVDTSGNFTITGTLTIGETTTIGTLGDTKNLIVYGSITSYASYSGTSGVIGLYDTLTVNTYANIDSVIIDNNSVTADTFIGNGSQITDILGNNVSDSFIKNYEEDTVVFRINADTINLNTIILPKVENSSREGIYFSDTNDLADANINGFINYAKIFAWSDTALYMGNPNGYPVILSLTSDYTQKGYLAMGTPYNSSGLITDTGVIINGSFGVVTQSTGEVALDSPTFVLNMNTNRVGIGTNTPSTELDVNGTITATLLSVADTISAGKFSGDGSNITSIDYVDADSISKNTRIENLEIYADSYIKNYEEDTMSYRLNCDSIYTNKLIVLGSGTSGMLRNSTDYVGIGTTVPSDLLEIKGDGYNGSKQGILIKTIDDAGFRFEPTITLWADDQQLESNILLKATKESTSTDYDCVEMNFVHNGFGLAYPNWYSGIKFLTFNNAALAQTMCLWGNKLFIGGSGTPTNNLDVYGSAAIGTSYAGGTALGDGQLAVSSKIMICTNVAQSAELYVNGTIRADTIELLDGTITALVNNTGKVTASDSILEIYNLQTDTPTILISLTETTWGSGNGIIAMRGTGVDTEILLGADSVSIQGYVEMSEDLYVHDTIKADTIELTDGYITSILCSTIKVHHSDTVTPVASVWTPFTWTDTIAEETQGNDYSVISDSTIQFNCTGIFLFGGCVHIENVSGGNVDATVGSRIHTTTGEARCGQRCWADNLKDDGEITLSFNGTVYAVAGDTIQLQYYTSTADIVFNSNAIFDNRVVATLWLRKCERGQRK